MHDTPSRDVAESSPTTSTSGARDSVPAATARSDRRVEEASEESFPASDPPPFSPARGTRASSRAPVMADEAPPRAASGDHTTAQARRWAEALIGALDREDLDAVGTLLTEDAVVRWGEGPLLVGRDASLRRVAEWFQQSGPVERHVTDVRGDDEAVFIELEVRGQRGGQSRSWPEAVSARLRRGTASSDAVAPVAASRIIVYGALSGEASDEPTASGV